MALLIRNIFSRHGDSLLMLLVWLGTIANIALNKENPALHPGELAYSINRGLLAILILYVFLPFWFEKTRYWSFCFFTILAYLCFGAIEEGVLEPFFFPDTRGIEGLTFYGVIVFAAQATPLLAFLAAIKLLWKYHSAMRTMQRFELDKASNELKFLKSQINPHILFNSLNNIYSYVLEKDQRAEEMILSLSDLLRYLLYECNADAVRLTKEIEAMSNYVELQKMGLEGRGQASLVINGNPGRSRLLPCILITIAENCFKHSMNSLTNGIDIRLNIDITVENRLIFTADNNFADNSGPTTVENRDGIGLANIAKQLKLVYGDDFVLDYGEQSGWYHVVLNMPLSESDG